MSTMDDMYMDAELIWPKSICSGCGNRIDPQVCHCGEYLNSHRPWSDHTPVPMGCDCMREPTAPPIYNKKPTLYGFNAGAVIAYIRPEETLIVVEKAKASGAWLTSDEILNEDEEGNIYAHHWYSPDGYDVMVNRADLFVIENP